MRQRTSLSFKIDGYFDAQLDAGMPPAFSHTFSEAFFGSPNFGFALRRAST